MPDTVPSKQVSEGDYIIVHFLERQQICMQFERKRNEWPLHITLVPWFYTELPEIEEFVEVVVAHNPSSSVQVAAVAQFGLDTTVSLIYEQEYMARLHAALIASVTSAGAQLRNDDWIGANYTAHITHHEGQPIPMSGSKLMIDTVSLVRLHANNMCGVVGNFQLRKER